jgi:tetratricopeptide (TPR) repeat protein
MPLVAGDRLGPYEVTALLGEGGMGEVYLAHDSRLDRRVAIKLLPAHLAADPVARERLRREAMAAAALDHPFICKVFEIGEDTRTLFIAMEHVSGETLLERLRSGRPPLAETLRIAGEITEALEEAHSRGFVHRDLKPSNVMLTKQGRVKVMDFGLAKRFDYQPNAEGDNTLTSPIPELTGRGAVVGTVNYMSPEQLRGDPLDQRSDIYSFGILLCEMTTGRHPFRRASSMETMAAILRDPPALDETGSSELSPGLMVVIRRLLSKIPAERYQSMSEVRVDLARLASAPLSMVETESPKAARVPLIERDAERTALLSQLDQALAGSGSLVLVGGEPGIGKTHLTEEILRAARRRGCLALTGHCYEMEGAPPYVPFIEMLEQTARTAPPETFRYAIGDAAPEVAKLMPELRRMFPDIPPPVELPPEQQRRFLFNAYRDFVERSARLTPLVAVFEDLHWADEPTLLLFEHIAQIAGNLSMLMIGTYRDVELDVNRPFAKTLHNLVRQKLATRMPLRRLAVTGVEAMLAAMSGHTPPPALARAIYEATEGNPFFVEEVFRHLSEETNLFDSNGAWNPGLRVDQLQVPESVRLVIGQRLERLSEETRRVLTTAAVIGRIFSLPLLEGLECARPDAALDAVEEAEQANLVVPERSGRATRYRFVHELIRQTLAETLSLPRRQRLHARVAAAIEQVHAQNLESHAPALAHHLFQAGAAVDFEKTVTWLIRAATLASATSAHEEALSHLDNALLLLEEQTGATVGDVHQLRAGVLRSVGRRSEAVAAYENALSLYDTADEQVKFAETSIELGSVYTWAFNAEQSHALNRKALQRIGGGQPALRSLLLFAEATVHSVTGDIEPALSELAEAAQGRHFLTAAKLQAMVGCMEAHTRFHALDLEGAGKASMQAAQASRDARNPWTEVEAAYVGIASAIFQGRPNEAETLLRAALPQAQRVGHVGGVWCCQLFQPAVLLARGDLEGAGRSAQETNALGQAIKSPWSFVGEVGRADVLLYTGMVDEALRCFQTAVDQEPPRSAWCGFPKAALAAALAQSGDPRALDMLMECLPALPVPGCSAAIGGWCSLGRVVQGLACLGRSAEAAALHPIAEELVATGAWSYHDLFLFRSVAGIAAACAREWTRAEEHHQTAIHQADTAPYRVAQPQAREWYAAMLLARGAPGDVERGRELLCEALAMFESIGMPLLAKRAAERLAILG